MIEHAPRLYIRRGALDGYYQMLKSDDLLKGIYIVALTGCADQRDLHDAEKSGFNYHIAKPVSIEELKQILDKVQRKIDVLV